MRRLKAGWSLPMPFNPRQLFELPPLFKGTPPALTLSAGIFAASIFIENLADATMRRLMAPGPARMYNGRYLRFLKFFVSLYV